MAQAEAAGAQAETSQTILSLAMTNVGESPG
jgi:hypothetical protein